MLLLLCFILFIWGIAGLCSDYDHEAERRNDYRTSERRHRETLKALNRSYHGRKRTTRVTRTVARDERGRIVAQEVTEDFIPNLDEIDIDEDDDE